ncbi:MAG TPA: DUF1343 domain-containing protein [Opitutaceae bacterium]|nr:DUF1343 domain-containing protein [Opitutaceae bacterium]
MPTRDRYFSLGPMPGADHLISLKRLVSLIVPLLALVGCSASQPPRPTRPAAAAAPLFTLPPDFGRAPRLAPVMLGIDVLEAEDFAPLRGKRIGLLTHPAGVDRRGVSTVDVLRHAPGVKLVALFGPEHGIYGDAPAAVPVGNTIDRRTGLRVYSLYGATRRPTRAMLKGIDALVIDLQDIGTRSYTFINTMKWAMEGCFEHGVEVVVLDRPNPLGGLKVDGPLLDSRLADSRRSPNGVGAFCVPYVHGLTIGELARMAKDLRPPTGLDIPDAARLRGKLVVIPMRGWKRSMRWPETGLRWIPTSPYITDFAAIEGYPMVGLGTFNDPKSNFEIGFFHGIGKAYAFRGISHKTAKIDVLERELRALHLPGLAFRRVSGIDSAGRPAVGLYVEITDYDAWQPTELNFYLMKLACRLDGRNPFLPAPHRDFTGFLHHMGSEEFLRALQREGARIDVAAWIRRWHEQDLIYQRQSEKYWLYR